MAKEEGALSGIGAWFWRSSSPFFEQKICRDLRKWWMSDLERKLKTGLGVAVCWIRACRLGAGWSTSNQGEVSDNETAVENSCGATRASAGTILE